MGNTLLQRLLLRSGGEHCDLELAVEVRQGGRRWANKTSKNHNDDIKKNKDRNRSNNTKMMV